MQLPKILITTYHEAFLTRGGGEFEISMIANNLKKSGFIADIYGPYSQDIESYDVVYHFSVHAGGLDLLRKVREHQLPIILSPNIYLNNNIQLIEDSVKSHIELADVVVFKSISEKENFCSFFDVDNSKVRIIPQSIDESIIRTAPAGLFKDVYNVENYALTFGIIEPNKNQLKMIEAVNELNIPLVLIGKYRDKIYYDECVEVASNKCMFIDSLYYHSEIMRSALQESDFFIEVSHEPAGISAIEAGLSGCNLIINDSDWSREHFPDYVSYVNPDSKYELHNAIESTLENKINVGEIQDSLLHHLSGSNTKLLYDMFVSL